MITGIMGSKGKVHFRFGNPINKLLEDIPADTPKNELIEKVATMIDQEIYRNYSFFPWNYVAYDMMTGEQRFANEYSEEDRQQFEAYLEKQIGKVKISNRDDAFLREMMVMMYGNTLKNRLLLP
jgi:hypothetical protein